MAACPEPQAERAIHEVAMIFPELAVARYEALKESIRAVGQIDPIWLHPDGRIIDGRHRYRACRELGLQPRFATWDGQGSLMRFVSALNALSRHMTLSQKVGVAVQMVPQFEQEARQRQIELAGSRPNSDPADLSPILGKGRRLWSAEQAAREVGVSRSYVEYGLSINRKQPALGGLLCSGHLELAVARRLVKAPREHVEGYLALAAGVPDPDAHGTPRELHRRFCALYGSIKDNLQIVKPSDWWAFGQPREKWRQPQFAGSIPGEVYANALYYFAPLRGVAADPMAGSGLLRQVYEDRADWQRDVRFDLEIHLFDLDPRPGVDGVAQHDATTPLPVPADWIFLDPPYFGQSAHLYKGPMAQATEVQCYARELRALIEAMAASLRPRGRLCVLLPKWSGTAADDPCHDWPGEATRLAWEAGLRWIDCAYVSRGRQQDPRAGVLNERAKQQRRMLSDTCVLHVFEKPRASDGAAR